MNNYYKDLWTKPNNHGTIFWRDVDFNKNEYKLQEHIFRQLLVSIKNLNRLHVDERKISSVLELGAGTGRMTKIMLEEGIGIGHNSWYTVIELSKDNLTKMGIYLGMPTLLNITPICGDIMDIENIFDDKSLIPRKYDLILASEVFMHIKPDEIEYLIKKLSKIGKQIINIDWAYAPYTSDWCFIHLYDELYRANGAEMVTIIPMEKIKQALFHYRFK